MDIASKFGITIKFESLIAIAVLLVASLLTITSPSPMKMGSMSMSSTSAISNTGIQDMSLQNLKNGSYIKETKIMNVNTKIEINPFHSGFNTFKVTFTDSNGKPYGNISTVRMVFKNDQADIGPITANLKSISTGVYAITGGYISQPGDWKISIAAQRPSNYDLNYRLNSKVNSTTTGQMQSGESLASGNNNANIIQTEVEEPIPVFDSFALIAIILAVIVGVGSYYFYRKSKNELNKTLELLGS
jgi:hypothetical protein